ncbi:hypothetical protein GF327_09120 [Candidatus Woesearchaeota archaeon]|nr:hypothetical protein [Candidatus Woesearchaeota archaeon]
MISVQKLSKKGLSRLKNTITEIAEIESMYAHKRSVEMRFEE